MCKVGRNGRNLEWKGRNMKVKNKINSNFACFIGYSGK